MKYNEKYDRYVTEEGLVYRKNKDGVLILCKQTIYNGYYRISVVKPKYKLLKVHRLVWETFNGEIPDGYEIDHQDTHKDNNTLSNLRCVTHTENMNNPKTIERLSKSHKGKTFTEEHKRKISETLKKEGKSRKNKTFSDFGRKFKEHFGFSGYYDRKLYLKEWYYNRKHNRCSWE